MPLLLLAIVAIGGYAYYKSHHAGFGGTATPPPSAPMLPPGFAVALDPNLPDFNKQEVINALYYQHDPSVLMQMSDSYLKAGYPMAAGMLAAQAHGILVPHPAQYPAAA